MAIFRKLHTAFWQDAKVIEELTPEDKFFFIYLLTNPATTQIGIYQITKKQMSFELGYSIESINSLMDRFENHHKLIKYNTYTREIALKNWGKYNLDRSGKPMLDCVKKELEEVSDISLIEYVSKGIKKEDIKDIFKSYKLIPRKEYKKCSLSENEKTILCEEGLPDISERHFTMAYIQ